MQKTFIVAEIGANHNDDLKLIKKTMDAAVECGVDAVKFQTYSAPELVADSDRIITYSSNGKEIKESIGNLFDRLSLKREWHREIFEYANHLGIIAFSTPFSIEGSNFLNELGVPLFKIAASDVNYIDMLKELPKYKKPIMLSLGKCTLGEADKAIEILQNNGCDDLTIMHCVSQYPSPIEEMNLNIIKSLKILYPNCKIGFSDHSLGITASIGAVALGATVIEKHFTLDKTLDGPDHWFSMDPDDMKNLVKSIRELELALGKSRKMVLACEEDERKKSIRSLVLKNDLKKGSCIMECDLNMLRPGWGISPFDKEKVLGMRVNSDYKKGSVLTWDMLK